MNARAAISSGEDFSALLRGHGANPDKLYAALGIPMPDRVADFSTNASVLPWPEGLKADLRDLASHYPDDECLELRHLVAGREGVSAGNVLFTNGSNEALYLLASFFGGRRAAILQPAYSEYRRALEGFGADVVDVADLAEVSRGAAFDLAVLSNPCNPTGAHIPRDALLEAVRRAGDTLFVVDEAYIDFLLDGDGEKRLPPGRWPENLIVLRSLTKFYHLSGARIGYVLGPERRIGRLKARQPTWSVNAVAQALALAFLRDGDFARRSLAFYRAETPRLVRALEGAGFSVRPSRVHFFLIDVDDDERFLIGLLRRGLVARHTRNFSGLDGRCLRVATRLPEENDRLVRALAELRDGG